MSRLDGKRLAELFAAGAYSVAAERGMSGSEAEQFAAGICKRAAFSGFGRRDDDEEEETFWSRNKNWLIPTLVGGLAFYLGSEGGQNGRRDSSHLANAGAELWRRVKSLFGYGRSSPVTDSIVNTPKPISAPALQPLVPKYYDPKDMNLFMREGALAPVPVPRQYSRSDLDRHFSSDEWIGAHGMQTPAWAKKLYKGAR